MEINNNVMLLTMDGTFSDRLDESGSWRPRLDTSSTLSSTEGRDPEEQILRHQSHTTSSVTAMKNKTKNAVKRSAGKIMKRLSSTSLSSFNHDSNSSSSTTNNNSNSAPGTIGRDEVRTFSSPRCVVKPLMSGHIQSQATSRRRSSSSIGSGSNQHHQLNVGHFNYNTIALRDDVYGDTRQPKCSDDSDAVRDVVYGEDYGVTTLLQWMEVDCPAEVLPIVMAFAGPQTTRSLSRTNKFWNRIIQEESTWRVMCELLYKWKPGDVEPSSWKELYRLSPCVPIDYPTAESALRIANRPCSLHGHQLATHEEPSPPTSVSPFRLRNDRNNSHRQNNENIRYKHLQPCCQVQRRSIRVLFRPGTYRLKESIIVKAAPGVSVSLETMELPASLTDGRSFSFSHSGTQLKKTSLTNPRSSSICEARRETNENNSNSNSQDLSGSRRGRTLRRWLTCNHSDAHLAVVDMNNNQNHTFLEDTDHSSEPTSYDFSGAAGAGAPSNHSQVASSSSSSVKGYTDKLNRKQQPPKHATLVYDTRRENEPVVFVQSGHVYLSQIQIEHGSDGTDIWNGNAAIQVQPVRTKGGMTNINGRNNFPTATLDGVRVSSSTGRGLVVIDGGTVRVRNSAIYRCAATGIYIGGFIPQPNDNNDLDVTNHGRPVVPSRAWLHNTDVVGNGIGVPLTLNDNNSRNMYIRRRRTIGIPRGHSGIYLEQGHCVIDRCNISRNTLTGLSAISPDAAIVSIENSSLASNGTQQWELPANGTRARRQSNVDHKNNSLNDETVRSSWLSHDPQLGAEEAYSSNSEENNMHNFR